MPPQEPHLSPTRFIATDFTGPHQDPLVVLIHGSLDRAAGMIRLARLIQPTHEVVRFDRRGYGRSWQHGGPFTVAGNVADVVEIVGDRRAILIGHSFGGNVALATAQALPEHIIGVSTYETPLSWLSEWPSTTAGALATASTPETAAENFMLRLIGAKRWEQLPDKTKAARRREGPALIQELTSLREAAPWDGQNIQCKVIAGYGSRALTHHATGAHWIADHVHNGHTSVIEGAGHGAPNSHPREFVDQLVRPHFFTAGTFKETS